MSAKKKRIASIEDPTLEAIAEGLFRFEREAQANSLLSRLAKQFVISKDQQLPSLKLWIRGYALTDAEKAQGFFGHFARLSVKRLEGGKVTIIAEKLPVPLKLHPQKERQKFRHPNWGHPILRGAQRSKLYPDIEQVRADLMRLHEEFPEASIPGRDKLHVMIYSRMSTPPIQKITLKIATVGDSGFKLESAENIRPPKEQQAARDTTSDCPPPRTSTGKFTTMVAQRRKKKPRPAKPKAEE